MHSYSDHSAEELAQDDFFRRWVQQPDAETNDFWTAFLRQYPHKQAAVELARALLKAVTQLQVLPSPAQGERMWATIEDRMHDQVPFTALQPTGPRQFHIGWRAVWAVAATVALLLGVGWWLVGPSYSTDVYVAEQGSTASATGLLTRRNETRRPLTVWLSDSSRVVLQPRSQVSYPARPAAVKREVYLTGDGFFEVVKNPQKPFLVYANGLVTQVIGTSFRVQTLARQHQVRVTVRMGKVAVFTLKALQQARQRREQISNRLLLTPNQQAFFDTGSERLTKGLVSEPVLLKQPERRRLFAFDNTPVAEAFRILEESYGVSIRYDATALSACSITAPLGDEPLFRKLDIICQTIGATYEVWGTQIIVTGQGCQ